MPASLRRSLLVWMLAAHGVGAARPAGRDGGRKRCAVPAEGAEKGRRKREGAAGGVEGREKTPTAVSANRRGASGGRTLGRPTFWLLAADLEFQGEEVSEVFPQGQKTPTQPALGKHPLGPSRPSRLPCDCHA